MSYNEKEHGKAWTTEELQKDFDVLGFLAPYVAVCRKADGVRGSLRFDHSPRLYYSFEKAEP